jgi:predicted nucleotidyltransferase
VRNEAKPASYIDIIVDFDSPATPKQYFGMQFYLEDLLAKPVDLVTVKAMRPELRPFKNEAINV